MKKAKTLTFHHIRPNTSVRPNFAHHPTLLDTKHYFYILYLWMFPSIEVKFSISL